jgi:hypothetical protein
MDHLINKPMNGLAHEIFEIIFVIIFKNIVCGR